MRATELLSLNKILSPEEKAKNLLRLVEVAHAQAIKINARINAQRRKPDNGLQSHLLRHFCARKKAYATANQALQSAAYRLSSEDGPSTLRVYQCKECKKWHLTSKALRVRA